MSVPEILGHYGFVDNIAAHNLKTRATGEISKKCMNQEQ